MSFTIELRNRQKQVVGLATVDDCDKGLVVGHSWCLLKNGYAASRMDKKLIYLHRLVMRFPPAQVDHWDRNKLNCQRDNLRTGTDDQNKQNVPGRGGSSKYRGVFWSAKDERWMTGFGGAKGSRKRFKCEEAAGAFIERWRLEHLQFARPEVCHLIHV